MGQFELIAAIFVFVIVIYLIVLGIKKATNKSGKSEKDIVAASKERNKVIEETVDKPSEENTETKEEPKE